MNRNQANVDPDAIETAARNLDSFIYRVSDFDARLENQLARLGMSFRDQAYDEFCSSLRSARTTIHELKDEGKNTVQAMRKDAEKIREIQAMKPEGM